MKTIHNNQLNSILFSHNDLDLSDSQEIEIRQLGSQSFKTLPLSIDWIDCFTVSYSFTVPENYLSNARHIIYIVDSAKTPLFVTTVEVDGNDDIARAYIVEE